MRKTAAAVTVVLAFLFSALALGSFVGLVAANPFEYRAETPPIVSIHSPINGTKMNIALLNFTVTKPEWWAGAQDVYGFKQKLVSVHIKIDGKHYGWAYGFDSSLTTPFDYAIYLTNLADGQHTLTIQADAYGFSVEMHGLWKYYIPINSSSVVYFTLDTIAPLVSVVSMENKTLDVAGVSLNFTVNEPCSQISYVLDGEENVTITGNSTLSGLPIGDHNVTVYAWDDAGNVGSSETVTFAIAEPESPASFPTVPVAVASATSITVVSVGLLVYFRKRKR